MKDKIDSLGRSLGGRIRDRRFSRRLSQSQLAFAANLDQGYVNRVESGRIVPGLANLVRICAALGAKPSELLKEVGL